MELKIEYLPIKALKPYEKNTRKHQKKDIDNIARSIEKFGMNDPIGIWKDNIIVEGHGRLLACKQLGMTEVPCVRLDHLTDEQRREYAIAHNSTAELSEWDLDILTDELAELDFSGFDFDFGIDTEYEDENYGDEFSLKDGDREPIQNMTFTFSDDEAEIIKEAISEMKKTDKFKEYDNPLNKNGNGNALFLVVEEWLQQKI